MDHPNEADIDDNDVNSDSSSDTQFATHGRNLRPRRNIFGDRTVHPCHPIPSAARLRALGAPSRAKELLALLHYFLFVHGCAGLRLGSVAQLKRYFRGQTPRSAAPGWILFAANDMLRLIDDVRNGDLEIEELPRRFERDIKGAENIGQLLPGGGQGRREARGAAQIEAEKWRRIGIEYKNQNRRVAESEMLWRIAQVREVLTHSIGEERVERLLRLLEKKENAESEKARRLREEAEEENAEEEKSEEVRAVAVEPLVPPEWMRAWWLEPRSCIVPVLVFLRGFWLASLYGISLE